jgi:hypothetical protein
VSSSELVPSTRVSEADWYGAALVGWGTVGSVIPRGYAAYARILHPATGPGDERLRWSDVAHACGTVMHPLAQFAALAGRWEHDDRGEGRPADHPLEGCLDLPQLRLAIASAEAPSVPASREDAEETDQIRSPSQWWPQDRAWCVASEIDFDSTLVAGSLDLVTELVAHAGIEAFQVAPDDDLSLHGDRINPLPPGQP